MFHDQTTEYHKAMRGHLRAGSSPALFEMDALRLTEMRHRATRYQAIEKDSLPGNDTPRSSGFAIGISHWLMRMFARNRGADVT